MFDLMAKFAFVANLGIASGFLVGVIFIVSGILSFRKNKKNGDTADEILLQSQFLALLGIILVLAGTSIIKEKFIWLGETVFAVIGIAILCNLPKIEKRRGRTITAILTFFIIMQSLHYLCLWLLA